MGWVMHLWGEELGGQDSKVEPAARGPWLHAWCPVEPPGPVFGVPWRKQGALGPTHCRARLCAARAEQSGCFGHGQSTVQAPDENLLCAVHPVGRLQASGCSYFY